MTSWGHWTAGWWLVLDALACYRLTRLAQRDKISQPARQWLLDLDRDEHGVRGRGGPFEGPLAVLANPTWRFAVALVGCSWCLSIWVGAAVVLATYFAPAVWSWPAVALALSAFTGHTSDREL